MISEEDRKEIRSNADNLRRLEELEKALGYVGSACPGTENIWPTHIKLVYGTCAEYECKLGYDTEAHNFIKERLAKLISIQEDKLNA